MRGLDTIHNSALYMWWKYRLLIIHTTQYNVQLKKNWEGWTRIRGCQNEREYGIKNTHDTIIILVYTQYAICALNVFLHKVQSLSRQELSWQLVCFEGPGWTSVKLLSYIIVYRMKNVGSGQNFSENLMFWSIFYFNLFQIMNSSFLLQQLEISQNRGENKIILVFNFWSQTLLNFAQSLQKKGAYCDKLDSQSNIRFMCKLTIFK